jgi:hypothetical protein
LLAFELLGDPERLIYEAHLLDNTASRQPPDLPFADLVRRLIALEWVRNAPSTLRSPKLATMRFWMKR